MSLGITKILNACRNLLIKLSFANDKSLCCFTGRILAFTMAEVLITLGILGVVASITLPTLINNHQKIVYVNSLKKQLSVFEQGIRQMMVNEGVDNLKHLTMFDDTSFNCYQSTQGHEYGDMMMKKYFKVVKIINDPYIVKALDPSLGEGDNGDVTTIYMTDGSKYMIDGCFSYDLYAAYVIIDTNGDKKPNQLGRDVFTFALNSQGFMMPYYGKKYAELFGNNYKDMFYWKTNNTCSNSGGSNGIGCAARLMENGWEMDY